MSQNFNPTLRNATVNPAELQAGLEKMKHESGQGVREHASHMAGKAGKGVRALKHLIKEEIHKNGVNDIEVKTTTTKRRNH